MQDAEIISLWKSYDKKLDQYLQLSRKNAEEITGLKVQSFISSMKPVKIFTILAGLIWVGFVELLIIGLWHTGSPFFLVSAAIQVLLTKAAIAIYLYQLYLIYQVDSAMPIVKTQEKLARLKTSTLWVTRLLFLQLPLWTTFYLNSEMLSGGPWGWYLLQALVTLLFLIPAIWLFVNIRFENRHKKWFRLIFDGKEWSPLMKSMEMLYQLHEFNEQNTAQNHPNRK